MHYAYFICNNIIYTINPVDHLYLTLIYMSNIYVYKYHRNKIDLNEKNNQNFMFKKLDKRN